MRISKGLLLKLLLVLISSFLIFVFDPQEVSASAHGCPLGSIIGACAGPLPACWDSLRIDTFSCTKSGGVCVETRVSSGCKSCSTSGGCRTISRWCSTADSCADIDPHPDPDRVSCGWNGSACGGDRCSSCGFASCCGPGPGPPPPICGDDTCDPGETCSSCPADCGVCPPTCGDLTCDLGEDCITCPGDCGACPPLPDDCTVSLTPASATTDVGDTTTFTASVTVIAGSVDSVDFSSSLVAVATVSPASDTTFPYNTVASSLSAGSTTITSDVIMGGALTCSATAALTVSPPCEIILAPSYSVAAGLTTTVSPGTPAVFGDVDEVVYTIDPAIASVCEGGTGPCLPPTGSYIDAPGFAADLTGVALGSTTLFVTGTMIDEPGGPYACAPASAPVSVGNPVAWFQVKGGDMTANGSISSVIPLSCILPGCDPVLITNDPLEDPGVPSFIGLINPGPGPPDPPDISSKDWNVGSVYSGPTPDYDFFESKLPSDVPFEPVPDPVAGSFFEGGPALLYRGYYWYLYDGADALTITSAINLPAGRRVVLMVKEDLEIEANINHVVLGRSFFMALAKENIIVQPGVGGLGTGPHLEGIFLADKQFRTETGSNQVHVRGGVAALSGIELQRELADNSINPAEIFEFGADQLFLFPAPMSQRQISWREVAP